MQTIQNQILETWNSLERRYEVILDEKRKTKLDEKVEAFRDEIALRCLHERTLDQYLSDLFELDDKKPRYSARTQLSNYLAGSFYGTLAGFVPHIPRLEDEPNYKNLEEVEGYAKGSFLATGFLPNLQTISVKGKTNEDIQEFHFNPLQTHDSLHMYNADPQEYSRHLFSKVKELFTHLGNQTSQKWLLLLEPNSQKYAHVLKHMYVVYGILPPDEVVEH